MSRHVLPLVLICQIMSFPAFTQENQSQTLDEMISSTDEDGNSKTPCVQIKDGMSQLFCAERKYKKVENACNERYWPNGSEVHDKQLGDRLVKISQCTFEAGLQYYRDIGYPDIEIIKRLKLEKRALAEKLASGAINEKKFDTLSYWLKTKQEEEQAAYEKSINFIHPQKRND